MLVLLGLSACLVFGALWLCKCSSSIFRVPPLTRRQAKLRTFRSRRKYTIPGIPGFVSKATYEEWKSQQDLGGETSNPCAECLTGAFDSAVVKKMLEDAAASHRMTDLQFLYLVPTAALQKQIPALYRHLSRSCPTRAKLAQRYLRVLQKHVSLPDAAPSDTPDVPSYHLKPAEVFPDNMLAQGVLSFIREFPAHCQSARSIAEGLSTTRHETVSKSTVHRVLKRFPHIFKRKTVQVNPRQTSAKDVDSFCCYLDALERLMARQVVRAKHAHGHLTTGPERARAQEQLMNIMAFGDQAPLNEGSTIAEMWSETGCPVQMSGDKKGGGTPDKWMMSAVITARKVIKVWLHVDEDYHKSISVNTQELEDFFLTEKRPKNPKHKHYGGGAIGPALQREGIRYLVLDQCGRSGNSADPVSGHFNPALLQHLAQYGVRLILLPPGGCLGNPIELFNGYLQRAIYSFLPGESAADVHSTAHRAPGVGTYDEAEEAVNKAVQRLNESKASRDHLANWYKQRAFGDDMWKGLRNQPLTWLVQELRRFRARSGLVVQRRPFVPVTDGLHIKLYSEPSQNVCIQSLQEMASKTASRKALKRSRDGGGASQFERYTLRPYQGFWRYMNALCGLNVLVGQYASKQLQSLKKHLRFRAEARASDQSAASPGPVEHVNSTWLRPSMLYTKSIPPSSPDLGPLQSISQKITQCSRIIRWACTLTQISKEVGGSKRSYQVQKLKMQ